MKRFAVSIIGSSLACALVLGCAGNDARKCKVSTLSDGGVRVDCPGSRTIVIPAGEDSLAEGGDECAAERDASTGEYFLRCKDTTVSLGLCGLGHEGSLFLGPDSHAQLPDLNDVDRRMNSRSIQSFTERECTRVMGTLYVSASAEDYRDFLDTVEFAERVVFVDDVDGVSLPELRAAAIEVSDVSNFATMDLPRWTVGGLRATSGEYEGTLSLGALQKGDVTLESIVGLVRIEAPALKSGSVRMSWLDDLESVDFPVLESVEMLEVWSNGQLQTFSMPALKSAESIQMMQNFGLENAQFPLLESANVRFHVTDHAALTTLEIPSLAYVGDLLFSLTEELSSLVAPSLTTAGALSVEATPALTRIEFPVLEEVGFDFQIGGTLLPGTVELRMDALRSVNRLQILVGEFSVLSFAALESVGQGTVSVAIGSETSEVRFPKLRNTELVVESRGTGPFADLVIDVSDFSFEGTSEDPIWDSALRLTSYDEVRPLTLLADRLSFDGWTIIEGFELQTMLRPTSGFRGRLELGGTTDVTKFDFSAAATLRELKIAGMGTQTAPLILDIVVPDGRSIEIQGGYVENPVVRAGVETRINFSSSEAVGTLTVLLLDPDQEGPTMVSYWGHTMTEFDTVDVSTIRKGMIEVNATNVQVVDARLMEDDGVYINVINLETLNVESFRRGNFYVTTSGLTGGGLIMFPDGAWGEMGGVVTLNDWTDPCPPEKSRFPYITFVGCI